MTGIIECIWLGPTGSTPGIGFTITGESIFISNEKFDMLESKGLIKKKENKPKKSKE